jgi:hypothetical protein
MIAHRIKHESMLNFALRWSTNFKREIYRAIKSQPNFLNFTAIPIWYWPDTGSWLSR